MRASDYLKFVIVLILFSSGLQAIASEPPFLGPLEDIYLTFGDAFYLNVDAKYADPAESYELLEGRPGMVIDPVTGEINWTPTSEGDGGRVTIRAYNSVGEAVRSFMIYLTDGNYCSEEIISYWELDESIGDNFKDGIGGYTASTITPLEDIAGKVDRGKKFSPLGKTEQFIFIDDQGQYDFARDGNFAISMWFRYDGQHTTGTNNQVLLARGNPTEGEEEMWMILMINAQAYSPQPRLTFELRPKDIGIAHSVTPEFDIYEGEWYHVVAVYEGSVYPDSSNVYLYINGVQNFYPYVFPDTDFIGEGNHPMNFGFWDKYPSNRYPFNGAMDEILVYAHALNSAEVNNIYQDGLNGRPVCEAGNFFPYITSIPDTVTLEDMVYTYTLVADDLDGDMLIMSSEVIPPWATFDPNSGILSGTPRNEDVGIHTVRLKVTDGEIEATNHFTITVINTNDPPVFTSVPITSCHTDSAYLYFVSATDPEVDALTFSAGPGLPEWLTFEATTKILFGIPRKENLGDHSVKLTASDGEFEVAQDFTISITGPNSTPIITSSPTTLVVALSPYSYQIQAYDEDAMDVLSYSAGTLPLWLEFDTLTQYLTGTPEVSDVGNHAVALVVSDGYVDIQQDFTIEVNELNTSVKGDLSTLVLGIFPNPARAYIIIDFSSEVSRVEISDLSGKVLINQLIRKGITQVQIDVSGLESGLHMLRVFDNDRHQSEKLIIN